MLKILMLVPWPVYRLVEDNPTIREPDQIVSGVKYWFFKYWPDQVEVKVVDSRKLSIFYPLEDRIRIILQQLPEYRELKKYDLILTHDSQTAFLFSFLRSRLGVFRSIPHVMIDIGLPNAPERLFSWAPLSLKYLLLRQTFNKRSVSQIIFHSSCQRSFYINALQYPDRQLSYVPFGVETDYFKPEKVPCEDYVFAAGEFRDFETLIATYKNHHNILPRLKIRSAVPAPKFLPEKVEWLPRAPISTFKDEVLRSKFAIVPLHRTLRSTGLMTLLQSMALGKATLVSKVPSVAGYVEDGRTALYYKPYSSDDLLKQILRLSNEPSLVENLGVQSRAMVERAFTVEAMGKSLWETIIGVYKRVVA